MTTIQNLKDAVLRFQDLVEDAERRGEKNDIEVEKLIIEATELLKEKSKGFEDSALASAEKKINRKKEDFDKLTLAERQAIISKSSLTQVEKDVLEAKYRQEQSAEAVKNAKGEKKDTHPIDVGATTLKKK